VCTYFPFPASSHPPSPQIKLSTYAIRARFPVHGGHVGVIAPNLWTRRPMDFRMRVLFQRTPVHCIPSTVIVTPTFNTLLYAHHLVPSIRNTSIVSSLVSSHFSSHPKFFLSLLSVGVSSRCAWRLISLPFYCAPRSSEKFAYYAIYDFAVVVVRCGLALISCASVICIQVLDSVCSYISRRLLHHSSPDSFVI